MTNKKYIYITFISLLLAIVCWVVFLVFDPSGLELFLTVNAFAFSITFLCFLVICIVKALGKSVSPYRIFAVTDGILALGVAGYAVYDILTDTGWFATMFLVTYRMVNTFQKVFNLLCQDPSEASLHL